jgi:hypothetical protein
MFGPPYEAGCPVCSSTADTLAPQVPHLKARDTTLLLASRVPLEKLIAYRQRMGWPIAWVSSGGSDRNRDLGFMHTEEELRPFLECPQQVSFNGDPENGRDARTPSSPGTTPRQASLLSDRGRSDPHTHRKSRTSPRRALSVRAQYAPGRARATRRHLRQSNGSLPQMFHRRFASRSSQRCRARDALPEPPNAGGHGPDALRGQRALRPG